MKFKTYQEALASAGCPMLPKNLREFGQVKENTFLTRKRNSCI